jgi:hypothetical protein
MRAAPMEFGGIAHAIERLADVRFVQGRADI